MTARALWGAAAAALWLALPLLGVDDYYLHLLVMAGIFFLLSAGMNLLLAAGQLNLGHTAFFGIGAYSSGLLGIQYGLSPLWTLPAGALIAGVAGWLLGMLTLKLRGAYFVLVTISFAGVISLVSINWMDLTNGPLGLPGVPPFDLGRASFTLTSKRQYYYLMLVFATLTYVADLESGRPGKFLFDVEVPVHGAGRKKVVDNWLSAVRSQCGLIQIGELLHPIGGATVVIGRSAAGDHRRCRVGSGGLAVIDDIGEDDIIENTKSSAKYSFPALLLPHLVRCSNSRRKIPVRRAERRCSGGCKGHSG